LDTLNNIIIKKFTLLITKSRTELKPIKTTVKINDLQIEQDIELATELIKVLN